MLRQELDALLEHLDEELSHRGHEQHSQDFHRLLSLLFASCQALLSESSFYVPLQEAEVQDHTQLVGKSTASFLQQSYQLALRRSCVLSFVMSALDKVPVTTRR